MTIRNHSIKVNRALQSAAIGDCPRSAAAMLEAIPASVIARLTSREIAALLDANWRLALASKAQADREAVQTGAIWDAAGERMVELQVQ